jgi:hypothetical protein
MEKSVVHQVVVHVSDQDRKGDPPPEFFDIRLWLRTVLAKRDSVKSSALSRYPLSFERRTMAWTRVLCRNSP